MTQKAGKEGLRRPSSRATRILAGNIRAFRKARGLSQEDLADMCGLHRTYLGSVEREERNVTLSTLEVIAGALGISVPMLLTEGSIEHDDEE